MEIHREPAEVTVLFYPKDYWLMKNTDNPTFNGEYCLAVKIDMDYAGKAPQVGHTVLFLDAHEAEMFRVAGFDEI